ncbi:vomeronasal type-2 receptor 26-like [Engystomops pustulosus]|uniref:vomeronasal type-2 receptor 26-like n=1 Tax=Engystomops pustulosus TaxID=76066 RepID=UPI003AFB38DC
MKTEAYLPNSDIIVVAAKVHHPCVKHYVGLLTFIFAIDEINQDPDLLPNVTLGYQIYDTCGDVIKSFHNIFQIFSGHRKQAPNYSCQEHGDLAGFVGHSHYQAQFLNIFGYPMINYMIPSPPPRGNIQMNSFYTSQEDNMAVIKAVVLYLKHFGWNMVGLFTSTELYGDGEMMEMEEYFRNEGICIEYIIKFPDIHNRPAVQARNIMEKSISRNCTGLNLQIPDEFVGVYVPHPYYVYSAVYSLAHTLHQMQVIGKGDEKRFRAHGYTHKLQRVLRKVNFIDRTGTQVSFHKNGQVKFHTEIQIIHWVSFVNEKIVRSKAMDLNYFNNEGLKFQINKDNFLWKEGKFPQSRCNEKCSPGYRKAQDGRHLICCYDCVLCTEEEISNVTDNEICHKCPIDHWPDERKVKCLPKPYEFLSYESDILASVFSGLVVFFSIVTIVILGLFLLYWDTPIVRANNRSVSVTLLVSILLSFLSVFLFLGRPVDITCQLRQTLFSVFFTIAVSSVLSKTITVCIAFKATKPTSPWRKLMGHKLAISIVLVFSTIQAVICVMWLAIAPPYQEYDFTSYPGKIIIQCIAE